MANAFEAHASHRAEVTHTALHLQPDPSLDDTVLAETLSKVSVLKLKYACPPDGDRCLSSTSGHELVKSGASALGHCPRPQRFPLSTAT